jgi:hypothetical protein
MKTVNVEVTFVADGVVDEDVVAKALDLYTALGLPEEAVDPSDPVHASIHKMEVKPGTVNLEVNQLLHLLANLGEVEELIEGIGIDQGTFFTKVSMNYSNLNNMLLEAGVDVNQPLE